MKLALFFTFVLLITSCSVSKRAKLFKDGEVQSGNFHKEVKYNPAGSLMILDVLVNGEKARFLFDTGAPNVISPELSAKLNLKSVTTVKVKDSGGNRQGQECVVIDSISLDGIQFYDMGAVVVDLRGNDALKCMNIDGVFGANAMRKAFWELNFDKESISFSNNMAKLSDTSDFSTLKFIPKSTGTPEVNMNLNGLTVENVTFDTGSNGYLKVPKAEFRKTPVLDNKALSATEIGTTSYGVYGLAKGDSTFYRNVDCVQVGSQVEISDLTVEYHGTSKLLGTKIMRNYNVILDWNSNNIYLNKIKPVDYSSIRNFGFGLNYSENKLLVGSLFVNTDAMDKLKVGDQIIGIDEDAVDAGPDGDLCEMLFKSELYTKYGDVVKFKIKRGEEIFSVELKKEAH